MLRRSPDLAPVARHVRDHFAGALGADAPALRRARIGEVVELALEALRRDPYKADVTLMLAVAYHVIGRPRCADNLVERLIEIEQHPTLGYAAFREIRGLLHGSLLAPMRGQPSFDARFERLYSP